MGTRVSGILGFLLFTASSVSAHAVLLARSPLADATVQGPVVPVSLHFNSRIDGRRSKLSLVLAPGQERELPLAPQTAPDTIASEIKDAQPGKCRVRWQVLASDGHITRGEITFQVK